MNTNGYANANTYIQPYDTTKMYVIMELHPFPPIDD